MLRPNRGAVTIKYLPAMRRLSIARSVRVALLGLTLALTVLAGIGVASLYNARQRYEDRVAADYALETDAGKLLAAGVVEEATLRTAQGPSAPAQRRRARLAFEQTAAQARAQAAGDPPSQRLVDAAVAEQAVLRSAGAPRGAALRARSPVAALAARQAVRRTQARSSAGSDSRRALFAVLAGAALALISVLALVGALLARVRRPLEDMVSAAKRLSAGDLQARVGTEGPTELRTLADAFNAMAAALSQALDAVETDRRRLAVIIESIGDGLLVLDADGRVATANPCARRIVADLQPGVLMAEADPPMPDLASALEEEVVIERVCGDGRPAPRARPGLDRARRDRARAPRAAQERVRRHRVARAAQPADVDQGLRRAARADQARRRASASSSRSSAPAPTASSTSSTTCSTSPGSRPAASRSTAARPTSPRPCARSRC